MKKKAQLNKQSDRQHTTNNIRGCNGTKPTSRLGDQPKCLCGEFGSQPNRLKHRFVAWERLRVSESISPVGEADARCSANNEEKAIAPNPNPKLFRKSRRGEKDDSVWRRGIRKDPWGEFHSRPAQANILPILYRLDETSSSKMSKKSLDLP